LFVSQSLIASDDCRRLRLTLDPSAAEICAGLSEPWLQMDMSAKTRRRISIDLA
jgi:hypothetical protein